MSVASPLSLVRGELATFVMGFSPGMVARRPHPSQSKIEAWDLKA
jgi:hypothetical protein